MAAAERRTQAGIPCERTRIAAEERETLQDYQIAFERHRNAMTRLARRFSPSRRPCVAPSELSAAAEARAELRSALARLDLMLAELRAGMR